MSTYKCPECGSPINLNERHCANCDYDITDTEYATLVPAMPTEKIGNAHSSVGSASQKNAMPSTIDSIMSHGNVDASTHHMEDKSTHNIDNSQTVNNTNQTVTNTFIIMGGVNAAMPQNIDPQTAEALKQAQHAQVQQLAQQQAQPAVEIPVQPTPIEEGGQKGIGSIDGRRPQTTDSSNKWWIALVAVGIVVIIAIMFLGKEKQSTPTATMTPATNTTVVSSPKSANTKTKTSSQKAKTSQTATSSSAQNKPITPSKPVDANYEKGMRLYEAGEGLAAIQAFKTSGSKESLQMIGKIYEKGCGSVEANAMMARKYYKESENKK